MDKQTQKTRVVDWLREHGALTVREAVTELGIMALPRRVFELKREGVPIALEWKTTATGARYGVYRLIKEDN